jgi:type IV pilus assembly protein PilA
MKNKAFTLIELMIVIAIIAIIAAIAIPNLLESRITANESAAAASLKSGLFPAEVTFQGGNYCDTVSPGSTAGKAQGLGTSGASVTALPAAGTGNGVGDFAAWFGQMAGAVPSTDVAFTGAAGTTQLSLLPPQWASNATGGGGGPEVTTLNGGSTYAAQSAPGATVIGPNIGSYVFALIANNENAFVGECGPSDGAATIGRRMFAINQAGQVYTTQANPTNVLPACNAAAGTAAVPGGPLGTTTPYSAPSLGWVPKH